MKKQLMLAVSLLAATLCFAPKVDSREIYLTNFNLMYGTEGTKLDSCVTCHSSSSSMARNPYGQDIENRLPLYGNDVVAAMMEVEFLDSDGDGYDFALEISGKPFPFFPDSGPSTFPGDPLDYPGGPGGTPGCYDFDQDFHFQYIQGNAPFPDPECFPSGDCDDTTPFIFPGAAEVCGDGIDNNCDGYADGTDPAVSADMCCADADGDGFSGTDQPWCTQYNPLDCNDNNPAIVPGGTEVCGDGIDNNCDGYADGTDPAVSADMCCADADGDGFSGTDQPWCTQYNPLDCNDNDPAVVPGGIEVCGDGIDNNCDGVFDESDPVCEAPCTDTDNDGFFAEGSPCGTQTDCNDSDYYINPAASEICNDNLDNNCNGYIDCLDAACANDPACVICTDSDGDGYAVEGGDCGPVDCNDSDLGVHPGAVENCEDARDNDCDDLIDCVDADCNGAETCTSCIPEAGKETKEKCQDTLDNDCDGVVDCADPDCAKERSCK